MFYLQHFLITCVDGDVFAGDGAASDGAYADLLTPLAHAAAAFNVLVFSFRIHSAHQHLRCAAGSVKFLVVMLFHDLHVKGIFKYRGDHLQDLFHDVDAQRVIARKNYRYLLRSFRDLSLLLICVSCRGYNERYPVCRGVTEQVIQPVRMTVVYYYLCAVGQFIK